MDQSGVQSAIVSITAPGVGFATGRAAAPVARATNEYLAQLRGDHPARYGAFAILPLPDVEAALAEIDYATGVLGLDGVGLFSSHRAPTLATRPSSLSSPGWPGPTC
jgi:predicted TIM-barrel fold metal-dependent hydrolase